MAQDLTDINTLFGLARDYVVSGKMSKEEQEEQRRSFAHGNVAVEHPYITRDLIDGAADKICFDNRKNL
jgi:hypothetical protein